MSKTRAIAREAREAARAAEVARAQTARARRERRAARKIWVTGARRPPRPRARGRQRRVLLGASCSFLLFQFVVWQFVDDTPSRLGLGLLSLALFPIATRLVTDPRSRR